MNLLRVALQAILANRIRAVLSILALSASVVGIVTVASGSSTVQASVTQRALLQGGPVVTVQATGLMGTLGLVQSENYRRQLAAFIGDDGHVVRSAQLASTAVEVRGVASPINAIFTEPNWKSIHPYEVVAGQWLTQGESSAVVRLVVNRAASSSLGLSLGDSLHLRTPGVTTNVPAIVMGIVEDGELGPTAFASLGDGAGFLSSNSSQLQVALQATGPGVTEASVTARLAQLSSLGGTASPQWTVQRIDTVERLEREVDAARSAFVIVGILALLAGALATANVALSALRERSQEMSLRRALGARRWHIPVIMIIESQIIAVIAGLVAVAVSLILYPAIAQQFGAPYGVQAPDYPWAVAGVGIVVGMVTALIGSLVPVLVSLRLPLVSVMRA